MASLPAAVAALVALAGVGQGVAGWLAVRRFVAASLGTQGRGTPGRGTPGRGTPGVDVLPAITVLKPLYRDEPMLEDALASVCAQNHPCFQVIFGVQNPADPARAVAERVRARFPDRDIVVWVDDTADGANRKVANLMNMLPAARHDLIVIADSDIHAAPDYLRRIAEAFAPGVGLVTTLYTGLPANPGPVAALGASGITQSFLPGALLARAFGRQDCLGATMALRRATLAQIGGFAALLPHLADDHMLGRLVRAQGGRIALAATVPATTVAEATLRALFRHELRWGRTILSLAPVAFALSAIQFPLAWSLLAVILSGAAAWAIAAGLAVWAARALLARGIDRALRPVMAVAAPPTPAWLFPLRDLLSVAVVLASFAGDRVEWRGRTMRARHPRRKPAGRMVA